MIYKLIIKILVKDKDFTLYNKLVGSYQICKDNQGKEEDLRAKKIFCVLRKLKMI